MPGELLLTGNKRFSDTLTNWAKRELISNSRDNRQRVSLQTQARGSVRLPSLCGLASCNVTDNLSLQSRWPGRTLDVDTVTMSVANQGPPCAIRRWLLLSCNLHWTGAKEFTLRPKSIIYPYRPVPLQGTLCAVWIHLPCTPNRARRWRLSVQHDRCGPSSRGLHFPDCVFQDAYMSCQVNYSTHLCPMETQRDPQTFVRSLQFLRKAHVFIFC